MMRQLQKALETSMIDISVAWNLWKHSFWDKNNYLRNMTRQLQKAFESHAFGKNMAWN